MAKAVTSIKRMPVDPETQRQNDLHELENALLENKDAITDVLALLNKFHDTEAFNIAHSLMDQKNPLLNQLVKTLDDPHITQALKNLLVLVQSLGSIKLADLEPMLFKINSALHQVADYEHNTNQSSAGYLFKSMKDPKTLEGVNTLIALLKGMGEDQTQFEHHQPQFELTTIADKTYQESSQEQRTQSQASGTNWLAIAAGAIAFAIPFMLRKK
ncbi:DUF1641 domain-containing protein [Shouchella sp. 1P09AA]|uniref:DUF1641 domain-containing protein n=1 Tax=unclassified Shouchella TaxID=2893065 RepID=UPI0039A2917C